MCSSDLRFARHHAERGTFPCYTKVNLKNVASPFGHKHRTDYLHATQETGAEHSQWQRYLAKEHADQLRYRILNKNRLNQHYISNAKFKELFPDYIAGKDLKL